MQREGIVVTQFHMSGWPEHSRPASTGSVVEMLDMITKAQMSSGNRAITVLCNTVSHTSSVLADCSPLPSPHPPLSLPPLSDGVGRTGTFICLHSQLERLKTEGVVDFFQVVKSAHIQRDGPIPYAVCHENTPSSLTLLLPLM